MKTLTTRAKSSGTAKLALAVRGFAVVASSPIPNGMGGFGNDEVCSLPPVKIEEGATDAKIQADTIKQAVNAAVEVAEKLDNATSQAAEGADSTISTVTVTAPSDNDAPAINAQDDKGLSASVDAWKNAFNLVADKVDQSPVLQRRLKQFKELEPVGVELAQEMEEASKLCEVNIDHPMLKERNVFCLPVRNQSGLGRHYRLFRTTDAEYEAVKGCLRMDTKQIMDFANGDAAYAAQLQKMQVNDPKGFITSILVGLSHHSDGINSWLHKGMDQTFTLYKADGTIDRSQLPSDKWDVEFFAEFGEVAYLKAYKHKNGVALGHARYRELKDKQAFVDNRLNQFEIDMQRESSFLGRLMVWARAVLGSKTQLVQQNDKSKQFYGFPREQEKAFEGNEADVTMQFTQKNDFMVTNPVNARMHTNAVSADEPVALFSRIVVNKIFANAADLRSVEEGGLVKAQEKEDGKPQVNE